MRADVNVSVRKPGGERFGTRCEIKNVNSIRFVGQAIEYEARRQIDILEDGGTIDQETRLFDPVKGETRSMRSKEEAHDYRYFPTPTCCRWSSTRPSSMRWPPICRSCRTTRRPLCRGLGLTPMTPRACLEKAIADFFEPWPRAATARWPPTG
jgi:Asp-tRNA(Asn)/Glu-tRNA(Gln) amidotransferase B subunit